MAPVVLGVPYDRHSSFLRGPAQAPRTVRAALHSGSANYCAESGRDLNPAQGMWSDAGDLDLPDDVVPALELIEAAAASHAAAGSPLLTIGGDHLVTWPLVKGLAQGADLSILHIDAHPDLYDELDGDRYSHACPFARIMEDRAAGRLVQLGIRTATPHQREQAARFDVEMLELRDWDGVVPALQGPLYISIDVDGLDPAFAPGVSHHEPGGLTTRQVLSILRQVGEMPVEIVGADIVEINPERDIHDVTSMLGAKLLRELLDLMI